MSPLFNISGVELGNVTSVVVRQQYDQISDFRIRCGLTAQRGTMPELDLAVEALGRSISISASGEKVISGTVWAHQMHLDNGPRNGWVELIGQDKFGNMATRFTQQSRAGSDGQVLYDLLESEFNRVTFDTPPTPDPERIVIQAEDDWSFATRLADRNGWGLWIDYSAQIESAAVGSPSGGVADHTLRVNQPESNVDSVDSVADVKRVSNVVFSQVDVGQKQTTTHTSTSEATPTRRPLSSFAEVQGALHVATGSPSEVDRRSTGFLDKQRHFIRLQVKTSQEKFGSVVSVGQSVDVSGCGRAYDGTYFVSECVHTIDLSTHAMKFSLLRDHFNRVPF